MVNLKKNKKFIESSKYQSEMFDMKKELDTLNDDRKKLKKKLKIGKFQAKKVGKELELKKLAILEPAGDSVENWWKVQKEPKKSEVGKKIGTFIVEVIKTIFF